MTFTPSTLRKSGFPRQTFSHEQLLQICYFYRNLLKHLRGVQAQIDAAIDAFQHTQYGRASVPLTKLITELANIDAGVRGPLLEEIMQVELVTIRWEEKSSRLRSEAKRQRNHRAKQRAGQAGDFGLDGDNDEFAYTPPGTDPFATEPANVSPTPTISPTMARAQRGMAQLPQIEPSEVPDTSEYKKSGLV